MSEAEFSTWWLNPRWRHTPTSWIAHRPDDPEPEGMRRSALTAEECAEFIAAVSEVEPEEGRVGPGNVVAHEYRTVEVRPLPKNAATSHLWARLVQAVLDANDTWFHFELSRVNELEVLRYTPGGKYVAHVDWGPPWPCRKLSAVAMLSAPDAYEGGDLLIIDGSTPDVAPREQGAISVFPSWTLHQVTPVTAGERWTATVWVEGPPFR